MTPRSDFGQRPHPNTIPCSQCGHVWFEGERRHHYVDDNGEDTIEDGARVLCALCAKQEEHPRKEEERFEW
jgi:hypothetical protein